MTSPDCDTPPAQDDMKKLIPSREVLRQRTTCPGCGVYITYHALAYKHRCPRVPNWNSREARRQRQIESLQATINARIDAMPMPANIPVERLAERLADPAPAEILAAC